MNAILYDENQLEREIQFNDKFSSKIRRLPPGKYQIVYKNQFGEFSNEKFELKKGQKKVVINLDYNQLDSVFYLGERTIDKLENGDSLRFWFNSNGCFHHTSKTAVFFKQNDQLLATNLADTVALDSAAIQQIRRFETEFSYSHFGGCTTHDLYALYLNGEVINIKYDDSCDWSGYYRYINPLFPEDEDEH